MSLPNIFGSIEDFFSGLFRPVTNVFSGGINAIAGLPDDIINFGNSVIKTLGSLSGFLSQIPSEILSFFSQIPGAIIAGLHVLGSWVMSGLHTLGSAIAGALKTAWSGIVDVYHFIANILQPLISFFTGVTSFVTSGLKNMFTTLTNLTQTTFTIINDSVSLAVDFMNYVLSLASNFSKFIQDGINLVTANASSLVSTASQLYGHFTDSAPFNILKQESSRFANVTGRLTGYNVAMEVIKETIRRNWLAQNMSPLTRAIALVMSPFVGAFAGLMAENVIKSFYPDSQVSTIARYTPPTTSPYPFPYHTTHVAPPTVLSKQYATTLSNLPEPPFAPSIPSFRPGHVITVYVEDLISLPGTGGGLTTTGGLVTASQYAQMLSDTLNIDYNLVVKLLPTLGVSVTDQTQPQLLANITTSQSQTVNTLTVNTFAEIGQLVLPLGATICKSTTVPQGYISGESLVDYLDVYYSICMPINNVTVENVYIFVTTQNFPPNLPTTEINIKVTTEQFPPNLPTTELEILVTTENFPPNLPTTEVNITVSPQTPPFTGVTTVPYVLNGVTTYFGFQGYALSTTATPQLTICFKGTSKCETV